MITLQLPISLIALVSGIASIAIALYQTARLRTRAIRLFTIFNASLFAMTVSFAWRSLSLFLSSVLPDMARIFELLSTIAQDVGGTVMIAVLPLFVYSLFDRDAPLVLRRIGLLSAVAQAGLSVAFLASGRQTVFGILETVLLFASILMALIILAKLLKTATPASAPIGLLRVFMWLSLVFVPLFIGDMAISQIPPSPWLQLVDNCSLPVYFLVLNCGLLVLVRQSLDQPPLMEGERLSDFARARYQLTEREAEVLEYIMDGYTLKDLAGVLAISPKTAENHLYAVYQKTGVSNRIQLFQFFQNRRRDV
jgi:DNA-binding CsgD family transcriptional regulator